MGICHVGTCSTGSAGLEGKEPNWGLGFRIVFLALFREAPLHPQTAQYPFIREYTLCHISKLLHPDNYVVMECQMKKHVEIEIRTWVR